MSNINIEQVVSLFLKKTNCDLETDGLNSTRSILLIWSKLSEPKKSHKQHKIMISYCSKFLFFKIEDMEEEKKNIDELKSITKDTLAAVASELKPAESSEVRKLYLFI